MNIGDEISRAIKEGKWLNISYINKSRENTFYWIAVKDIDFESKKLYVSIFNDKKSMNSRWSAIYFDSIQSAQVIGFSSYDVPYNLINKIEKNLDKCRWLNYDHFNHNILNYYNECNILDCDPSQKQYSLISGIDFEVLRQKKEFKLNDEQARHVIADIYHYDIKNISNTYYTLVINKLSIDIGKEKYVIAYHKLTFDPDKKSLVLDKRIRFNQSFLIQGRKHSLFNYINMDIDEFTRTFGDEYSKYYSIIKENLKAGEIINERPDMMLLQREVPIDLSETYRVIEEKYANNQLPTPLKSFFGNITKRNYVRRKEPSLIIYDRNININQMRVLYNAMKYPVTYVQGPPGTGKTQTILNVVLCSFYNSKTVLICSSNNKPVDGIVEKLNFEFRGEKINFPYLRLGNYEDVSRATLRIKELYEYFTKRKPKEELLNRIKNSADDQNAKLIELLNIQEKRVEIEDFLESSNKLIRSFNGGSHGITDIIKIKVEELKKELSALPEITNEQVVSLFSPLKEDEKLSEFLFYKSLEYILKLKKPRYSELIEICSIEDDNDRVTEFNKWTQSDTNIKKLTEVFPIIFTTNISSRRLGSPRFMFDLVVMDEAGQCNVATALVPIAKAESLLLVGDPMQLKPVIILQDDINSSLMEKYNVIERYDYKENSILSLMVSNDNISKYIKLKYHYRCGKKIIGFSNQRYYENLLNLSYIRSDGELELLNVKNNNDYGKNEAIDEVNGIVEYIQRNNIHDAFILTPFVNQKELLQTILRKNGIGDIGCGTIHSLQGAEKDTIILSTAISRKTSERTYSWLKNNAELLNVATTRAKKKLVVAVDTDWLNCLSDKKDDLYSLVEYVKNNGEIKIPQSDSPRVEIGKSNASVAESEFYKTISHFCSCHTNFDFERNVSGAIKLEKILNKEDAHRLKGMEIDGVLYERQPFSRKKPVIAFEINGGEHFGFRNRELSDKKKIEIFKKNKITLVMIHNSFVKSYEYITKIIEIVKNRKTAIQSSLFDEISSNC